MVALSRELWENFEHVSRDFGIFSGYIRGDQQEGENAIERLTRFASRVCPSKSAKDKWRIMRNQKREARVLRGIRRWCWRWRTEDRGDYDDARPADERNPRSEDERRENREIKWVWPAVERVWAKLFPRASMCRYVPICRKLSRRARTSEFVSLPSARSAYLMRDRRFDAPFGGYWGSSINSLTYL